MTTAAVGMPLILPYPEGNPYETFFECTFQIRNRTCIGRLATFSPCRNVCLFRRLAVHWIALYPNAVFGCRAIIKTQQGVVAVSALLFVAGFVFAGLDHRFGWSEVPMSVVIAASVALLVGYGMYAEVMRENAYLSRTIEVQDGQKVIDTGLYGVVRHPMYLATILLFLSIPLVLGSWLSLLFFAFYPIVIIVRIGNEEKVLTAELSGYTQYKEKVKYRLIPYIW